MSPVGAAPGVPSCSEIDEWSTRDLDAAAGRWRASATESDEAFAQHRANVINTTWAGDAKDAAVSRVNTDAVVVAGQTAVQRASAQIAEDGSRDIQAAKREALGAIAAAEADGFEVGEDLSVTDTREVDESEIAARTMAAREHAEDIRWFAERLVQTDEFVGKRLQEKAVELEDIRFDGERDDRPDSSIQLMGNMIGSDAEDKSEGRKEEQAGGRTWRDMLLPAEESDAPNAERSERGPDAAAGEDADPADDGPPNPLDVLAGKGSSADPDTPANVDEALFGPGAATPPSVLDRLAAQARGEKSPADTPYTRSPLEDPVAAADPSIVDQQVGRVEAAQQAVAAAQADLDAAAAQTVIQGAGAGPGRDVTEPLTQALFDARAELTTQTDILENLNQAAAETGGRQVEVPALPENADVQAFPAPPSAAEQAREGLTEFSHDISEKTFGIVPDVAEIAEVYANWGEHSGEEQLGAILDTSGSLPLPGAKPLGEALHHGLDLFTAGRHADDVVQPGIPHEVVDSPSAGHSGDAPSVDAPTNGHSHADAGLVGQFGVEETAALLAHSESSGGHLIERHVAQTSADLAARLETTRLPLVSSFSTTDEAAAAVSTALQGNQQAIDEWLSSGAVRYLELDAPFNGGAVLERGSAEGVAGTGVRVVLKGDGNGGWYVLTGFPTP
ncbi:RNase A-like domain-containing protein [Mycobacterium sp. NPDC051804]|uniref:RNase A-like domain-containing protein n=1 Tax=Mycobacterium sp. NPDC051804 TaxID=3364295 RepID=UPI00379B8C49